MTDMRQMADNAVSYNGPDHFLAKVEFRFLSRREQNNIPPVGGKFFVSISLCMLSRGYWLLDCSFSKECTAFFHCLLFCWGWREGGGVL